MLKSVPYPSDVFVSCFAFFDRAEKVWKAIGKEGLAVKAPWPKGGEVDKLLTRQAKFLRDSLKAFRAQAGKAKAGAEKSTIVVTIINNLL